MADEARENEGEGGAKGECTSICPACSTTCSKVAHSGSHWCPNCKDSWSN